MDKGSVLKGTVAFLGTALTWLFGTWDIAIAVLALFMVLDQITGVMRAKIHKKLDSSVGAKGIFKKMTMLIVLIVAVALDRLINKGNWVFRTLVCYFYIANEGLSLLENCSSMGLPIPKQLKDGLAQLKQGGKKEPRDK